MRPLHSLEKLGIVLAVSLFIGVVFQLANGLVLNADESLHYGLASHDLHRAFWGASFHAHPPLHYLVMFGWMKVVGPSPLAARCVSMGFCGFAILFAALWARRLAGPIGALGAVLTLVTAPLMHQMALEVRSYCLLLFFLFAALYVCERINERFGPWAFALCCVGAALSHYSGVLALIPLALWAWLRLRSNVTRALPGMVAGGVVGVAFYLFFTERIKNHLLKACGTYLHHLYLSCPGAERAGKSTALWNFFATGEWGLLALGTVAAGLVVWKRGAKIERHYAAPFVLGIGMAVALSWFQLYPFSLERHGAYLLPFFLFIPIALLKVLGEHAPRLAAASLVVLGAGGVTLDRLKERTGDREIPFVQYVNSRLRTHIPGGAVLLAGLEKYTRLEQVIRPSRFGIWFRNADHLVLSTSWGGTKRAACHWGQVLGERGLEHFWTYGELSRGVQAEVWDVIARSPLSRVPTAQFKGKSCAHSDFHATLFQKKCWAHPGVYPCHYVTHSLAALTSRHP